jgi:hypothetical protein
LGQAQVKLETKTCFENLYYEDGKEDIKAQEILLNNIPRIIILTDNKVLFQPIIEAKIFGVL